MSTKMIIGSTGRAVPASGKGQLSVDTKSPMIYAAQRGDVYVVAGAADPNGTDIDFFYLKNNDSRDLIIFRIRAYQAAGTDSSVTIKIGVTGDTTSGTAITPVNTRNNGPVANVTCEQRDADMALTGGTIVETIWPSASFVGEQVWEYEGGIILPFNTALVYNNATDPVANDIETQTFFYFAEPE